MTSTEAVRMIRNTLRFCAMTFGGWLFVVGLLAIHPGAFVAYVGVLLVLTASGVLRFTNGGVDT